MKRKYDRRRPENQLKALIEIFERKWISDHAEAEHYDAPLFSHRWAQ